MAKAGKKTAQEKVDALLWLASSHVGAGRLGLPDTIDERYGDRRRKGRLPQDPAFLNYPIRCRYWQALQMMQPGPAQMYETIQEAIGGELPDDPHKRGGACRSLSRYMAALKQWGLVERAYGPSNTLRKRLARLTPAGEAWRAELTRRYQAGGYVLAGATIWERVKRGEDPADVLADAWRRSDKVVEAAEHKAKMRKWCERSRAAIRRKHAAARAAKEKARR